MALQLTHRLAEAVRRPDFLTDLIQIVKAVVAATAAWWLSVVILDSQMPFLAPWTALLTVHATVHRSLTRGAQTTVASAAGVALSFVIGAYLGVSVWTFALALFIGIAAARLPWIRDEGVAIATTAIFVLSSGFDEQQPLLLERVVELAIGVAIGFLVNVLIVPPLRDRQATQYVDSINLRMGDVLTDMGDEFAVSWDTDQGEKWLQETSSMRDELDSAWQTARFATESRRVNPRRLRRLRRGESSDVSDEEIVSRLDEGISHLRHLTRTLREASYSEGEWDAKFRERWSAIVRDAGRTIADPDAEVEPIYDRLDDLSAELSDAAGLPRRSWPLYGSLITGIRHIAVIVDDVASAREAREA